MTADLVLRVAVTLELAVLATLLAWLPRAGLAARLGALFCTSVIAFVVTSAPVAIGAIAYPLRGTVMRRPQKQRPARSARCSRRSLGA